MARSAEEFEIEAEELEAATAAASSPQNGIQQIRALVADVTTPVSTISRLIGLEIVDLLSEMSGKGDPLKPNFRSQRELSDQVKAFRELQKTLAESDILSKKDSLNLEGDKFKFVFKEIVHWFQLALEETRIDPAVIASIMQHFRDQSQKNEPDLRRALNKFDIPGR